MTKAELIANISKEAKITKAAAEKALNSFTGNVTKALKKGELSKSSSAALKLNAR